MTRRYLPKLTLMVLLLVIVSSITFAFAGNIVVPTSRLTSQVFAITARDLAPASCNSIRNSLTTIIVCSGGGCSGSNAGELILGTAGPDQIDGKNGADCIVGGGGNDDLNGGNDDDVLLGDDGDDVLDGGRKQDNDICYGGSGSNTFTDCDLTP